MAEDFAGEKTEPATPRKREEARSKGQVAKSQDLNTSALLIAAFVLLYFMADTFLGLVTGLFRLSWSELPREPITTEQVVAAARGGVTEVLWIYAPILGTFFVISFLINFVQVGWRLSAEPLQPKLSKIDPIQGAKRIVSLRAAMRLLFGVLKLVVVGTVIYIGYLDYLDPKDPRNFLALMSVSLADAMKISFVALFSIGLKASIALLVLALLDHTYQRWQFERDLRMTKQEVKEEQKRMEGDPRLRQKRRTVGQQLALQRMIQDVPKADVVITNPTHYSCAIRYDEQSTSAPVLLAKGQGHLALRIRDIARTHGIAVVEEPPLARELYATTEVGEEIPPNLYGQVARVLAYVYQLGQGKQRESVS